MKVGSASGTLTIRGRMRAALVRSVPCDVPTCPYSRAFRPLTKTTGLIRPRCRQPVATIEDEGARTVIFHCPRCEYRWSTDHAATKVH
jgi:hypothetical protein